MKKSPDAFRTIREVSEWLNTPAHVLRFWESKFSQVKPVKRAGGRRYYRPNDMLLIGGIKKLLHEDGMTIKGVQKMLQADGIKGVVALSQPLDGGDTDILETRDITPDSEIPVDHGDGDTAQNVVETSEILDPGVPDIEPQPQYIEDLVAVVVEDQNTNGSSSGGGVADVPAASPPTADKPTAPLAAIVAAVDVPADLPDDADIQVPTPISSLLSNVSDTTISAQKGKIAPIIDRLNTLRSRFGQPQPE